jgi:hypothetical protein
VQNGDGEHSHTHPDRVSAKTLCDSLGREVRLAGRKYTSLSVAQIPPPA